MKLNIKNKQPNQKMSRQPKQTFLQRRLTDGQEAQEKMLSITNYYRNAGQKYNENYTSHQSECPLSKNPQTLSAGEGVDLALLVGM